MRTSRGTAIRAARVVVAIARALRERWKALRDVPPAPDDEGIGEVVEIFDAEKAAIRMCLAQGFKTSRTRNLHTGASR